MSRKQKNDVNALFREAKWLHNAYLADMDDTWVELPALTSGVLDNFEVTGAKIVVAAFNGAGQAIATSSATTITNKS